MSYYTQAGIKYQLKPFDVDRSWVDQEMADKPYLRPMLQGLTRAETGPSYGPQAHSGVVQTAANRAAARGESLEKTIAPWGIGGRYYAPHQNGRYQSNLVRSQSAAEKPYWNDLVNSSLHTDTPIDETHNAQLRVATNAMRGRNNAVPFSQGGGMWLGAGPAGGARSEYVYGKRFPEEENFRRMGRTVVPAPARNPVNDLAGPAPVQTAQPGLPPMLNDQYGQEVQPMMQAPENFGAIVEESPIGVGRFSPPPGSLAGSQVQGPTPQQVQSSGAGRTLEPLKEAAGVTPPQSAPQTAPPAARSAPPPPIRNPYANELSPATDSGGFTPQLFGDLGVQPAGMDFHQGGNALFDAGESIDIGGLFDGWFK